MKIELEQVQSNIQTGITSYDFRELLNIVNSLITLNMADNLQELCFRIEDRSLLTPFEEKYILNRIENAVSKYYNSLNLGYIYVWNLPQNLRTYKAYLGTERHIKYVLHHGDRQLRAIYKLCRFVQHDNGVGKVMSEYHRNDVLYQMKKILKGYTSDISKKYSLLSDNKSLKGKMMLCLDEKGSVKSKLN